MYLKGKLTGFSKSSDQVGETRGGSYAARVQIGTEKDGSPMYRYFKTKDQYQKYLKKQRSGKTAESKERKKKAEELDEKVKKDRKESASRVEEKKTPKKGKLLTAKSLNLYLGDK